MRCPLPNCLGYVQGLDMTRAAESHFKSRAIERIRRKYPYNNIIMVGGAWQAVLWASLLYVVLQPV